MEALIPLLVIAFVAVAINLGARSVRKQRAKWTQAASDLGIEFVPGRFVSIGKLVGTVEGHETTVDTYTQRSGNNSQTYTRYRIGYPDLGLGLKLSRQTTLSGITKFFGAQDVETQDETFDDAFVVKADHPDVVQGFLTPFRGAALVRLMSVYPAVVVGDDAIALSNSGVPKDPQIIVSVTRRLVQTASQLSSDVSVRDRAIVSRQIGDRRAAAEAADAGSADDLEAALAKLESLHASGDRDGARAVVDKLGEQLPADPEVLGWRDRLSQPQRSIDPLPPTTQNVNVDPSKLASELFGGEGLSFETDQVFESRYQGDRVQWMGAVRTHRLFQHDSDFGDGPATKAVITVAKIDHDLYGNTTIDAVVRLPASAADRLERGQQVTFEGTLTGIDAFVRNLFIEDAKLV